MRRLTSRMIVLIGLIAIILPLLMPLLNAYRFLRFPLGYILAAQLGVILLAFLIYGFFRGQERNDRNYNMTIQF